MISRTALRSLGRVGVGALLFVFLSLTISAASAAPTPPTQAQGSAGAEGRNVEAIRIEGNVRLDTDTIGFFLATRVGAPFDFELAQQDYTALFNTDWFRNLVMYWEEGASGGVVLVIRVEEFPLLRSIIIEGTTKATPEDLIERLTLLELPVKLNDAINQQGLRNAVEVLQVMLQADKGLQFVQIELDIRTSEDGAFADAVYQVIEGDEVRIAQVVFEGNTVFSQKELRWALKRTGEHNFMSFMSKGDRFSEAGYQADMFEIGNLYRTKGYIDFNFDDPRIEVFNDSREIWWDDKLRLSITIPIYEGPQYHVGDVRVEGNTFFPDSELTKILDLHNGDVMNVAEVNAAKEAISAKYSNAGYMQVAVVPEPRPTTEEAVVDLVYRVSENAVYRVNRIEFDGNTHTRDHVMRRNLNLVELARWDQSEFQNSVRRLFQLGYFQDVKQELKSALPGEAIDPEIPADAQYGTVDVNLKVEEVGRNQISFGGGLSALEGGFLQLGYTTRNLFGFGQTVSINAQIGSRRENIQLSFADPYLFGKRLRFGVDVFRNSLDFPDFQRSGTGFSLRLGTPLNRHESVTLFAEYNYEVIDIGDVGSAFGGLNSLFFNQLFLGEGRRVTSSVRPFLFWSTIDSPVLPSAGQRTSLSFEYAGGPIGGTLDFWKAQVRSTWYLPTVSSGSGLIRRPKQILAINVRADWAEPHSDLEALPIFERFFLGGSNSVRGTRLRSIGPVDDRGNILGGTKGLQYNLEYIFALSPSLRVKVFHDAGQAWAEDDTFDLKDMRRTYGLEFEIFAPVFNVPFRLFWAYNENPLELFAEEKSTFEFAIGSTF